MSLHGIAINVEPDLSHFVGIVPCGVREQKYGVTSLVDLGLPVTMDDLDAALKAEFEGLFGPLARLAITLKVSVPRRRSRSDVAASCSSIDSTTALGGPLRQAAIIPATPSLDPRTQLPRAVAAVAHPAFDATVARDMARPVAKSHALHAAMNDHAADDALAHHVRSR